ncbi:MAG: electron transport complex subunit RsxD [Hahellaceae bacterium]|nr:electron transport complex subunit RsxD [Hahellaceae bacterium]
MTLLRITSPHTQGAQRTANVMRTVILATLPGLGVITYFFGWGTFINVIWCSICAVAFESLVLGLRHQPVGFFLKDYSALVTAVLLGLSLPPLAPWWVSLVAIGFAIVVAKHLYGGMGYNPFNPAMVGFALVLVSFPLEMTTNWATPSPLLQDPLTFTQTLSTIFGTPSVAVDAYTMATPLDVYKHEISHNTAVVVTAKPVFGNFVALGWEWVNAAFLLSGVFLIWKRIFTWHTPVSMLVALTVMSIVFGWDADRYTPPLLHLYAGATMLGAFFIATDPVTSAVSNRGKLFYGAGIGILVYIIRTWGSYPDAIAFSVLLMNFAAPFIDFYTQPRAYGHAKAGRSESEG